MRPDSRGSMAVLDVQTLSEMRKKGGIDLGCDFSKEKDVLYVCGTITTEPSSKNFKAGPMWGSAIRAMQNEWYEFMI